MRGWPLRWSPEYPQPKGLMSYVNQVAFQMKTKLGVKPRFKILMKKCGLSVGASMNNSMTNYLSVASLHSNPQQDLNDNMWSVISKDLRKYYKLNKEFSARIIVNRFVLNFYTLCPPSCPDQMIILFI